MRCGHFGIGLQVFLAGSVLEETLVESLGWLGFWAEGFRWQCVAVIGTRGQCRTHVPASESPIWWPEHMHAQAQLASHGDDYCECVDSIRTAPAAARVGAQIQAEVFAGVGIVAWVVWVWVQEQ